MRRGRPGDSGRGSVEAATAGRASSVLASAFVTSSMSVALRSVAGVRLTRRSMAFAKLASAARTCISPGVMRVVRRREELAGEGWGGAEEESATVGATEAATGPVVDSRGDDSARSLGGAAAEVGACMHVELAASGAALR
jgi:hypothetical protein